MNHEISWKLQQKLAATKNSHKYAKTIKNFHLFATIAYVFCCIMNANNHYLRVNVTHPSALKKQNCLFEEQRRWMASVVEFFHSKTHWNGKFNTHLSWYLITCVWVAMLAQLASILQPARLDRSILLHGQISFHIWQKWARLRWWPWFR